MFKDKVIVITGGAGGIGLCTADEFRKEGAHVYVIDIVPCKAENPNGLQYVGNMQKKRF